MLQKNQNHSNFNQLPATGLKRASEILHYLPFKKSTLWEWSKDGRFPAPIRLGGAMTCWRCEDVHAWLAVQGLESNLSHQHTIH